MAIHVPTRVYLSILIFCMFIATNICNCCLHISIVAMVDLNWGSSNLTNTDSMPNNNKLKWDALSVAMIQGAFFWGFCASKIPGGMLSRRYGTRKVVIATNLTAIISTCLFPMAAKIHPILASMTRATLGFANGMNWPAVVSLGAKWIPKSERSLFGNTVHGNGIAMALFYPIYGFIIEYYGWEAVFYTSGLLCSICLIFWLQNGYDSPSDHPTISLTEKSYIENALNESIKHEDGKKNNLVSIPWKSILTSRPFWVTAVSMHGTMWFLITLDIQLPQYFATVYDFDLKMSGFITGIPNFFKLFLGVLFGYYMDLLIKRQKCSITTVRKLGAITSKIIPASMLAIMALTTATDYRISVLLFALITTLNGTISSSALANLTDIGPNFAGVTTGLVQTTIGIPGILSPLIFSTLLSLNPETGWFWVFSIAASIECFTGFIFLMFASGKVQSWNEPKDKIELEDLAQIKKLMSSEHKEIYLYETQNSK